MRYLLTLSAIVVISANSLFAQSIGEILSMYDLMGGLTGGATNAYVMEKDKYTNLPDTLRHSHTSLVLPSIGATFNIPCITLGANSSIGVHTGGYFSIGQGAILHFPAMIQYKVGPDATSDSNASHGFALAGGYTIYGMAIDNEGGWFFKPSVQPEFSWTTAADNLWKIRLMCSFGVQKYRKENHGQTQDLYANSPFIGIYFGYVPHF